MYRKEANLPFSFDGKILKKLSVSGGGLHLP